MDKITLKIYGLDCAEEVSTIKHELLTSFEEEQLVFDLINGKLTVYGDTEELDEATIIQRISSTGLKAQNWQAYIESRDIPPSIWETHGRLILAIASASFLFLGFFSHAILTDFATALSGSGDLQTSHPHISIASYFLAIVCGGWFIFPKALFALKRRQADMNLLMCIAVTGAVIINQWFEAATVTCLFATALLLESWSVGRARNAIKGLMDLTPETARYYCPSHGDLEEKPIQEVPVGVTLVVRPGERFPLDGVISKGVSYVNEAPITGESMPSKKTIDSPVYAGTINGDNTIEFISSKRAEDSTLSRIITMIEEGQANRAHSERWVERFARIYTPSMMLFALLLAVLPPLVFDGDFTRWFYEALVILVIACPCALVISTPVSIVASLSRAASQGILIKGGNFLELPARLSAIAFDKTGTLTMGKPSIQEIIPLDSHSAQDLLGVAASLEDNSDHPVAYAICEKARSDAITIKPCENFKLVQGRGIEGVIDGKAYWIGSHRWLHEKMPDKETKPFHQQVLALEDAGHSILIIGTENHICGLISVADAVREESAATIAHLKRLGVENLSMLTGDNIGTARAIAAQVNVDEFYADLLPQDKVSKVQALCQQYSTVAMVGDGINDAPAMANATFGIAMGVAGSDAAIETADIALMKDDITKIAWLIQHSRRTLAIIKQNISFALGIKVIFILLTLFDEASLWMAIAADMGASLVVIFNGLRLLKNKRYEQ